jgi:hypothetical protein
MKISSLLERQTGYNLDRQMAALHSLEKEAQDENVIMRELAVKSSHDSSSVRILTIITLIYLPCTVVSVNNPVRSYPAYTNNLRRASIPRSSLVAKTRPMVQSCRMHVMRGSSSPFPSR